jgi:two-component system nitrate/nitrite response regulator NarL
MGSSLATVVVEPRLLVREALKSLMANNSYPVVCDVGSTAEIAVAAVSDEPKLVVLGAQSADNALNEAVAIRKLWPDSKIILLYEHASAADVQNLLASEINGCVPLSASPDTLIGMIESAQVMVVPVSECPVIQPAQREQSHQPKMAMDGSNPHGGEPTAATMQTQRAENGASTSDLELSHGTTQPAPLMRSPKLSEREVQILNGPRREAPLPIGARTLTPDELAKRKAELEARDGTRYVMPNSRIRAGGRVSRHGKW